MYEPEMRAIKWVLHKMLQSSDAGEETLGGRLSPRQSVWPRCRAVNEEGTCEPPQTCQNVRVQTCKTTTLQTFLEILFPA